jgi:CelD/BcsL family acetyltransferase involved in cellulose biosynthesis
MPGARWTTLAELEDRQREWRTLAAGSEFPTAFADPAWILAWWRSYGAGREPWLLALEDRDRSLRGLALLACKQSSVARTLRFAGEAWNGLETLVCAPGAEAELSASLLEGLAERRREWDVWRVQRMPAASLLARTLLDGDGRLRAAAHDVRLQPFLALPGDVESFEARFGAKQRNTVRRKWRRLTGLGAVANLVSDPDELGRALKVLVELRRARAIVKGQRYKHMDARFERFLLEAVRGLLPDGARLWTLTLDKHTLATHLNLVQGPREHSYLLGLSDAHARLSPGNSLEHHAIHESIREGRAEFDLGPGRDAYKYRLSACDRDLTRLVVSSESARGHGVAQLLAADLRLRNTGAAEVLRRRRGLTPERATSRSPGPVRQRPISRAARSTLHEAEPRDHP